ncbi:hypothetical protein BC828DRAFT_399756 [Blastocladiella britannica]|nr:hypothetical protein BC828DRAFT_399756 [Blastocladiella britannica]
MTSPPGAISAPAPVPPPPPCPHCAATTARAYALVRHLTHQADAAATDLVQSRAACNEWEVRYHQLESALVALQMRMDAVLADENDYGPHDPHYHVGNGAGIEGHDGDRNRAIHVRVPPPGPSSLPVFADALVQTRPAPPLAHAAAQTPHADVRPPPNRASQVSPPLHRALRLAENGTRVVARVCHASVPTYALGRHRNRFPQHQQKREAVVGRQQRRRVPGSIYCRVAAGTQCRPPPPVVARHLAPLDRRVV